jgi:hypothetical protein
VRKTGLDHVTRRAKKRTGVFPEKKTVFAALRVLGMPVLTAVENGGEGTVSRRSKMVAHNRAVLWEVRIGATAPVTHAFTERHRNALRHTP